jgi:flagellar motor switch protein FliN
MPTELTSWLLERWLARFAESIEAMAGERPELAAEGHSASAGPPALIWRQALSLGPGADVLIRAEEALWQSVGARVLGLAGIDNAGPYELRSTFIEILAQSVSLLASEIGRKLGREVTCAESSLDPSAGSGAEWQGASIGFAGETHAGIAVAWGARLLELLEPQPTAPPAREIAIPGPSNQPKTMDLLLEVDLPVSVSFGRSQMRLKDVVKLTTGSIVELNRSISEPVEIIVNNCVIARGEVVVVEGNYGVRIKQIVSRQERLRSLF